MALLRRVKNSSVWTSGSNTESAVHWVVIFIQTDKNISEVGLSRLVSLTIDLKFGDLTLTEPFCDSIVNVL